MHVRCHLKIKSGLIFEDLKIKSGLKSPFTFGEKVVSKGEGYFKTQQ